MRRGYLVPSVTTVTNTSNGLSDPPRHLLQLGSAFSTPYAPRGHSKPTNSKFTSTGTEIAMSSVATNASSSIDDRLMSHLESHR